MLTLEDMEKDPSYITWLPDRKKKMPPGAGMNSSMGDIIVIGRDPAFNSEPKEPKQKESSNPLRDALSKVSV
jgi:hypothetical protein